MIESGVELRELRAFVAVAEELHFARAADRLDVTASRVSQTIAMLEARLGTRLFHRTSRRVSLTRTGEQLLREVRPHVSDLDLIIRRVSTRARGIHGTLRLGTYTRLAAGPFVGEIFDTFRSRYPGADGAFVDTGLVDYLALLRRGGCDIVVGRLPCSDPDITVGPVLTREERALLVASDHPLARKQLVTLEDIADTGLPMSFPRDVPREFLEAFVPPMTPTGRPLPRCDTTIEEMLLRVARAEQLHPTISSFLDYYAAPGTVSVPLDLPPSETALIWVTATAGPLVEAFARVVADVTARHDLPTIDPCSSAEPEVP
ncbi:MAG: LysR family transcriptional regulator [Solirubrobacteraceae bacterium]